MLDTALQEAERTPVERLPQPLHDSRELSVPGDRLGPRSSSRSAVFFPSRVYPRPTTRLMPEGAPDEPAGWKCGRADLGERSDPGEGGTRHARPIWVCWEGVAAAAGGLVSRSAGI